MQLSRPLFPSSSNQFARVDGVRKLQHLFSRYYDAAEKRAYVSARSVLYTFFVVCVFALFWRRFLLFFFLRVRLIVGSKLLANISTRTRPVMRRQCGSAHKSPAYGYRARARVLLDPTCSQARVEEGRGRRKGIEISASRKAAYRPFVESYLLSFATPISPRSLAYARVSGFARQRQGGRGRGRRGRYR